MVNTRQVIKGTPISGGIALGYARIVLPGDLDVAELIIPQGKIRQEVTALDTAVDETVKELRELRDSADKKMGGAIAKIFDAQLMIASDQEFLKQVKSEIRLRRRNAGFVYNSLVKEATAPLKGSSDSYMQQMSLDIEAVANRVLSHLSGYNRTDLNLPPNTILISKIFTPGDILTFRKRRAVGFLIGEGGRNSHMALITRALMLPVVLAKDAYLQIANDDRIIVDGTEGEVIVNPTDRDWAEYQKLRKRQGAPVITRIKKLPKIPPETADGKVIGVGSNLTLPGPADDVLAAHRIPVGLYRTEFLYLSRGYFPDEQTQFEFYDQIAQTYAKSTVTFRTFDLGYDKLSLNGFWPQEDNPALGWRGIRAMLSMDHVLKNQLRAILRASHRGNVKIMIPMVTDISEIDDTRKILSQVKFSLKKDHVPFDENIEIGIMVEVPSTAMMADTLAGKVDFLSIGTNDLTQYTLAADRMNSRVAHLYKPYHPSVLKLIAQTVEAAKKHKVPVSICGEMAGDLTALPLLIGLEVDLLSMNPVRIFDLCRLVGKVDFSFAKTLARSVLAANTNDQIVTMLRSFKQELEKKPTRRRK